MDMSKVIWKIKIQETVMLCFPLTNLKVFKTRSILKYSFHITSQIEKVNSTTIYFDSRHCRRDNRTQMAVRVEQLFQIPVLLVLCQMLYEAVGQQCAPEKVETSILGMMLRRHIYKRITEVEYGLVCSLDCY